MDAKHAPDVPINGNLPKDATRWCNTCAMYGAGLHEAQYVVENAEGIQWFECDQHSNGDHLEGPWVRRVSLARWLRTVPLVALGFRSAEAVAEFRRKTHQAGQVLRRLADTMGEQNEQ